MKQLDFGTPDSVHVKKNASEEYRTVFQNRFSFRLYPEYAKVRWYLEI